MGAIVFGCGFIALSFLTPEAEQAKAFELPHEAQERKARIGKEQKLEQIDELKSRFEDQYSRGLFDDARITASKAMALTRNEPHEWVRRLADATFMSEALPAQQRFHKAYEGYSKILTNPPSDKPEEMEWARYRSAECLLRMRQWDEAMQAMEIYLRDYAASSHVHEVRLMYAQSLMALGRHAKAREELKKIPENVPEAAKALLELARIDSERLNHDVSEAIEIQPDKKSPAPETVKEPVGVGVKENPVKETVKAAPPPEKEKPAPAPAVAAPKPAPAPQPETVNAGPLDDLPEAQWESIRSAAKHSKLKESQRLMEPWLASDSRLTADGRARALMKYARMLRELSQGSAQ